MVLEPCEQMYEIEGMLVMVMGFELRLWAGGAWTTYPYTTQIVPTNTIYDGDNGVLYTFHLN